LKGEAADDGAEPDEEPDDGFPILPSAAPIAVLFLRSQQACRRNAFNGAPDGVDWGEVEAVARMTAAAIDGWVFDVLAEMFREAEKIAIVRWRDQQKAAEAAAKRKK
jgi:hypothetical protein